MENRSRQKLSRSGSEAGMTLVETMIALAILLIVAAAIMSMGVVAIGTTENQGHLAARTTEYAQDKMEQLISLSYTDSFTNTTVFPATVAAMCPPGCGLAAGGNSNPAAPVNGYVDYLDANGNLLGGGAVAPANWYYIRVWQISTAGLTANLKQITVTAKVRFGVGSRGFGALAESTVATLKSNPF